MTSPTASRDCRTELIWSRIRKLSTLENNKRFDVLQGEIEFAVSNVDEANGDVSGVFVSKQPGDTDMGGKVLKTILSKENGSPTWNSRHHPPSCVTS